MRVKDLTGKDRALGLVNYSSEDMNKIAGHRSSEIEKLLGYAYGEEVVHHNNMTLPG